MFFYCLSLFRPRTQSVGAQVSVQVIDRIRLSWLRLTTRDSLFPERSCLGRHSIQLSISSFPSLCDGTHHLPKRRKDIHRLIEQHRLLDYLRGIYGLVGGEECDSRIIDFSFSHAA